MRHVLMAVAFLALILVPSLFAGSRSAPTTQAEVLRKIHLCNQTEIKAGKLAKQKGTTQEVRDYGQKLVDDHTKADRKVQEVAKREKIDLNVPQSRVDDKMRSKESKLLEELQNKQGKEFDEEFADEMASSHEDTIKMLQQARDQFPGSATAKLIDELLPTLTEHEHIAERLEDKS